MVDLIQANKRKSALLVTAFIVVVSLVGAALGAAFARTLTGVLIGVVIGLALAVAGAAFAYWKGADVALRVGRARPAHPDEFRRLHNLVDGLCIANGLPSPHIHVIEDHAPNAFAVGRHPKHASLAVTTGLLEQMNRVELEGVIAHELSHIRHHDTLVSTLAVTTVGAITMLGDLVIRTMWWNGGRVPRHADTPDSANRIGYLGYGALAVAPFTGWIMRSTVSPRREILADLSACQMTRYPPGLVSALEKLDADTTVTHSASTGTAHLWIAQPMSGVGDEGRLGGFHRCFDTHPSLDERIALLREL